VFSKVSRKVSDRDCDNVLEYKFEGGPTMFRTMSSEGVRQCSDCDFGEFP
jgi:hypothetical protein